MKGDLLLDPLVRAEDIILGALGFGEAASLVSIFQNNDGYTGIARFDDGEEVEFQSDGEVSDVERWAIEVILKKPR